MFGLQFWMTLGTVAMNNALQFIASFFADLNGLF